MEKVLSIIYLLLELLLMIVYMNHVIHCRFTRIEKPNPSKSKLVLCYVDIVCVSRDYYSELCE